MLPAAPAHAQEQPASDQQHDSGQAALEERRCTHCGSRHTCGENWRRHATAWQRLCHNCRTYAYNHGGQLPPDSVLQPRPAEPRKLANVRREMAQRRCLRCGSASPGGGKKPCWYRHPVTGEEWLCVPCRSRLYRQLRKHSRQQAVSGGDHNADEEQQQQPSQEHQARRLQPAQQQQQQQQQQQALQPAAPQLWVASAAGSSRVAHQTAAERRRKQLQPRGPPLASDRAAAAVSNADAADCMLLGAAAAVPAALSLEPESLAGPQQQARQQGLVEPEQQQGSGQTLAGEQCCSHCGSCRSSSDWRRHPTSGQRLCHACSNYGYRHGGQLPADSVLQQRRQQTAEVKAQRRCLQCGTASPGSSKQAHWYRHPVTGQEWLCEACRCRARLPLKRQRQRQGTAELKQQQLAGGSAAAGLKEQPQATASQPQQLKRRRDKASSGNAARQALHGSAAAGGAVAAAAAGRKRGRSHQQQRPGQLGWASSDGTADGARQLQQVPAATAAEPQPAAKRRRKQAQPQRHLAPESAPQLGCQQPALPLPLPTVLGGGAAAEPAGSEGPASASLHGSLKTAAQVAVKVEEEGPGSAAVGQGGPQLGQLWQAPQAAEQQPPPPQQPAAPIAEQQPQAATDLLDLLQQAMDVAAAAASGLMPELVGSFAALPPLDARRVSGLLRLSQLSVLTSAGVTCLQVLCTTAASAFCAAQSSAPSGFHTTGGLPAAPAAVQPVQRCCCIHDDSAEGGRRLPAAAAARR